MHIFPPIFFPFCCLSLFVPRLRECDLLCGGCKRYIQILILSPIKSNNTPSMPGVLERWCQSLQASLRNSRSAPFNNKRQDKSANFSALLELEPNSEVTSIKLCQQTWWMRKSCENCHYRVYLTFVCFEHNTLLTKS